MNEKPEFQSVSSDEYLALKNLIDSISKEELESAKEYLEAILRVNNDTEDN